jgi:cystathionine gamma-lyase
MSFQTRAVHGGQPVDGQTRAVTFPIYQTSTFGQSEAGHPTQFQGRELSYSRSENPSRTTLENALASLEEAKHCVAFASGLAAVQAVLNTLSTGDHLVVCQDLYGGTYRMLTKVYRKFGLEVTFVDATDLEEIRKALRPDTKIVWLESPSNPLLNITDLSAASEIAHAVGATVVVDNTFASPYLQRPLDLGADLVIHSTTKYLNGHADVIGGAALTNDPVLHEAVKFNQNATGTIPGPQDCFLVLRGIKTLGLRMERHCANARGIAEWLNEHPKVEKVYYPGLPTHPGHEVAARQMKDFGGMLSFVLDADVEAAKEFLSRLKILTLAESLGAVRSLVCHPPTMTHASVEPEVRRRNGIPDGLIRVSTGIEDTEDLVEDLRQALDRLKVHAQAAG